jgi:polar amino acid transport system substrate-binding protein
LQRRKPSPTRATAWDQAHTRVVVGKGSEYDPFLTGELKAVQIVRAPSLPSIVPTFGDQQLKVAAGLKHQLEADARKPTCCGCS